MRTTTELSDKDLRKLRRLSTVPRWSIVPTVVKQNVAEHTFHVCHVALWLAERHALLHSGKHTGELLLYALKHDMDEAVTGDMPTPSKPKVTPVRPLIMSVENSVKSVAKIADSLEAYLYTMEEFNMGNQRILSVQHDIKKRMEPHWNNFEWHVAWGTKPTLNDIIAAFMNTYFVSIHPGLENAL